MRTLLAAAAFLTLSSAAHAEPVRDDNPAAPHNRIRDARSGGTGLVYGKLGDVGAVACVATVAAHDGGYAAQVYVPGAGFGPWVGVYLSDEDAIDEAVTATERLFGATC